MLAILVTDPIILLNKDHGTIVPWYYKKMGLNFQYFKSYFMTNIVCEINAQVFNLINWTVFIVKKLYIWKSIKYILEIFGCS